MTRIGFAGLAALAVLATAPVARAQGTDADHWNWRGVLARGKTLEIRGIAGSIRAEVATGAQVEVSAVKRGPAGDRADVHIVMEQGADGVTICAVYGDGGNCRHGRSHSHADDNDASVDFVARVPAGVAFQGAMVSGDVEVSGLSAEVDANSVSGDVAVRNVHGDVTARSVSGRATLDGVDGQRVDGNSVSGDVAFTGPVQAGGRYVFRSVSGDLTLRVDGTFNAEVSLTTVSGEIESDFPITLGSGGRFGRRNLDFTVGTGGARVELGTVSGDFHLRRGAQPAR